MSIVSSAIEFALGLAAKALRLTRVELPPKLEGPRHEYEQSPPFANAYTPSQMRCLKCGLYNARRAAFTTPPCSERLPSTTELP